MPSRSKLGELVDEITVGYVGPMIDEYADDGVPFLRSLNVKPHRFDSTDLRFISPEFHAKIKKSALSPGDVVAVRTGIPGTSCVIPAGLETANCSDLVIFRCGEKVDPHYLSYYLNLIASSHVRHQSVGAVQKHFNIGSAKDLLLPDVGVEVQQKIAAVLSALDAKIDLNNRINAELEALAKTIYDYWFVQFDFPDAHGRPYKPSGGAMVWNDTLKREIPAGWEAVAIGQACETILGGTPNTKNPDYWDCADIPWLSSGETASFPVVTSEQKITAAGIRDSAAKLLPAGTVVVSIVRYIRPSILGIAAATNQSVAGILETAQFPSSYLYPAVCREVPRWMDLRTGAQQPHINKATIDGTLLVKPSKGVIDAYRKIADPLFKRVLVAANENRELTQLRDWLLPLLMNGQVRVA